MTEQTDANVRPFISIVTRACQRPKMLSENIQSVKAQTCHDLEQVFIVDHKRSGIQAADRVLHEQKQHVSGLYIYLVDDDCIIKYNGLVEEVRDIVSEHDPDIVMVKSMRPAGPPSSETIFPARSVWGGHPSHGTTNALCYITRSSLWKEHVWRFGEKPWGGDWWLLKSLLDSGCSVFWHDRVVADARQLGRGRLFEMTGSDWWPQVLAAHPDIQGKGNIWKLKLWKGT